MSYLGFNPFYSGFNLAQAYGVPQGNFITAPGYFYKPRRHIKIIKRGVIFTLEAKCQVLGGSESQHSKHGDDYDVGDNNRYTILCTVSVPKARIYGSAQFTQEPGQRVDEQKTIAMSSSIRQKKILSAPSLVFPEGMLSFIIDDVDYPNRVTYVCDLKLNYKFKEEVRREMVQALTQTRNHRFVDCYDAYDY